MSDIRRRTTRRAWTATALAIVAACSGPRDFRLTSMRVLAGFRQASPVVAELTEGAAGLAVFVGVEADAAGCAHAGILVLPDGEPEDVVLRCLEAPRAPGGSSYHQLVVLRDPAQVELLHRGPLDMAGFARLAPHDDHALEGHEHAPGWIVSTQHSQLLFGDPTVRQRLEPAR